MSLIDKTILNIMKIKMQLCLTTLAVIMMTFQLEAQLIEKDGINYQKEIQSWLATSNVPAIGIGIIDEGKLKQIMVFGYLKKNYPAPYNTIFQVASLTKPVTAMLTLKLVSMGEWQLDEPLSNYWVDPDVIEDPRHLKLTTRHVLTHQTGFDNWRWNNKSKKLAFNFEPGTQFKYSGEGFEYLKHALEHKFNTTLDRLADSLIFKPLKMNDTKYVWNEQIDTSRYAVPHDTLRNALEIPENKNASAADFLKTSIEDYSIFGIEVIKGTGLTQDVFNDMVRPQAIVNKNQSFGLGWLIIKDLSNGEYALFHDGSDNGTRTAVILLPKSKRGLVVFTNGEKGDDVIEKIIIKYFELGQEIINKLNNN
jgi:CubicO group peptidase (beta-lactamase class C family)